MDYFAMADMQALIAQAQSNPRFPPLSLQLALAYHLHPIEELGQCLSLAAKINARMKKTLPSPTQPSALLQCYGKNWVLCQYKLFKTILVLYSICHSIQIADMQEEHLRQLGGLFTWKERTIIDYEVATIATRSMKSLRQWTQEENALLSSIIKKQEDPNWKEVAIQLYRLSDKQFFRQFSECREQWNNHLNPAVTKAQWSKEEDFRLVELIEEYGFRWAAISKAMNGRRNEHMVKNRYNSLVKKLRNGEGGGRKMEYRVVWEEELLLTIQNIHAKNNKNGPRKTRPTQATQLQAETIEKDMQRIDESLTELSQSNKMHRVETKCDIDHDELSSIDRYLTLDQQLL